MVLSCVGELIEEEVGVGMGVIATLCIGLATAIALCTTAELLLLLSLLLDNGLVDLKSLPTSVGELEEKINKNENNKLSSFRMI